MAYNQTIEARIQNQVADWRGCTAKKMFGGVCHLMRGHMFCGVYKDYLILRLGKAAAGEALAQEHVRPFDITGRPMKGWVMVAQKGFESDADLERWLDLAREFVGTLPSK